MAPQRDVYARLASEKLGWMDDDERRRMQEISDRLGRSLDDLDASVARTAVLADEIASVMAEAMNRRTYTMSLLAMLFSRPPFSPACLASIWAAFPARKAIRDLRFLSDVSRTGGGCCPVVA